MRSRKRKLVESHTGETEDELREEWKEEMKMENGRIGKRRHDNGKRGNGKMGKWDNG